MIPALLTDGAMVVAMCGLGRPLALRLGHHLSPAEQWLVAPLIGALPLAALVMAMGSLSYTPVSMGALLAATALGGGLLLARDLPRRMPSLPRGTAAAVWAAVGVLVLVAALGAFAPPSDNDTLRYHLTLPRRDLELGRLTLRFGWSIYEFFPPLASMLVHLSFATGGAAAAQLLTAAWICAAAAAAALLVLRLGGSATFGATAALILAAQRVVINLGSAVTVDIALAAYVGAALVVLLALAGQERPGWRDALLPGLLLGAALNVKYHAIITTAVLLAVFAAPILARRRMPMVLVLAGGIALLLFLPLTARNILLTGNPLFPTFHPLFGPDNADIFSLYSRIMAERVEIPGGPWLLPLTLFLYQQSFDGFQLGFPIVLITLPFAFAERRQDRLAALAVCVLYVAAWWLAMPHLLRFLQPIFVPMAALAGLGLQRAWQAAGGIRRGRAAVGMVCAVAAALQSLFLGSTALHRLPAALGLETPEAMLERVQFVNYSLISPCRWLEARLAPGERYLPLVNDPSFHCPQASGLVQVRPHEAAAYYSRAGLPPPTVADLLRRMEEEKVRYLLVSPFYGPDDDPLAFGKHRYDSLIVPLLPILAPIARWPSGMVYDAADLAAALRAAP